MSPESTSFTRQNHKWIKSDSGSTFLCPLDVVRSIENPTEEQLRALCVDESLNPHNE